MVTSFKAWVVHLVISLGEGAYFPLGKDKLEEKVAQALLEGADLPEQKVYAPGGLRQASSRRGMRLVGSRFRLQHQA